MNRGAGMVVIAALLTVAPAYAGWVSDWYTDSYTHQTNWGVSPAVYLSFPKFNVLDATLTAVEWEMTGDVYGQAGYENLDGAGASCTLQLSATLTVNKPDNTLLTQLFPLVTQADSNVPVFDGTIDWSGTSGKTYTNLTDTDLTTGTLTSGLGDWTGAGNALLAAQAVGTSEGTGSGTWSYLFLTNAGVVGRVRYYYDMVPEPTTGVLMLVGLAGLVAMRRRRGG